MPHIPDFFAEAKRMEQAAILSQPQSDGIDLLPEAKKRLVIPIRLEGEMLGLVRLETRDGRFMRGSLYALNALADHAAVALENVRLFREIGKEKRRTQLIIDSVACALFTTDRSLRISTFNPAAEQLTGVRVRQALGRRVGQVMNCSSDLESLVAKAIRMQTMVHNQRLELVRRPDSDRSINLSIAPIPGSDGQANGAVVIFQDITEEEELRRLQSEMLAAISHELRAPLTNISVVAQTMRQKLSSAEYRDKLGVLITQSQRLADFSEHFLEAWRLETGNFELQMRPIPISLLVNQVTEQWRTAESHHRILCHPAPKPLWVWADERGIEMVLDNLIENAVKYAPKDTEIEIGLKEELTGGVRVTVRDQGPGIAPKHQDRVFERFYRIDGGDAQSVYGHGLGLYIARKLTEAMGGHIGVQSQPGKGSCFFFSLPGRDKINGQQDTDH